MQVVSSQRARAVFRLSSRALLKLEQLEARHLLAVNVSTFHNDLASTGVNAAETILTPANVKVGTFGKQFVTTLDGQVYAQPLVQTGVTIANGVNTTAGAAGVHDVVFAATQNDSLYAIDTADGDVLWRRSFLGTTNAGGNVNNTFGATAITTLVPNDVLSGDITPIIGITGTPVIDPVRGLLFVITKTKETTAAGKEWFVQRLHAIKLSDGTDAVNPYLIGRTTDGNTNDTAIYTYGAGDGWVSDPYTGTIRPVVQFNALREHQRPALSLVNDKVYVAWASHADNGPYHGWVAAWDTANLLTSGFELAGLLNTSPQEAESGIWQSGGRIAFEPDGSAFYFLTGNGEGGPPTVGPDGFPVDGNYNEAVVKAVLDPTTSPANQNINGWGMKVVDYFIPHNVVALDGADSDFGSGAPILLPDSAGIPGHPKLLVVGGKDGRLFVLDRNDLGKFDPNHDHALNSVLDESGKITPPKVAPGILSTPAWFNGRLYLVGGYNGGATAFSLGADGHLTATSNANVPSLGYLPGSPVVSANGTTNGIVWIMDRNANQIHAYDANSLSTELWNSGLAPSRLDAVGAVMKFAVPTVANGQVFVGTANSLVGYGLTPAANQAPQAVALTATSLSGTSINLAWTDPSTSPNTASAYLIERSTDGVNFTQITTSPAGSVALAIGGLTNNTKYYFRVRSFNGMGQSPYSNVATATTAEHVIAIDFSTGFSTGPGQIVANGYTAFVNNRLRLTDDGGNEASSAYYVIPVDVSRFTTQFTYTTNSGPDIADGFTFVLQRAGLDALKWAGAGLGYGATFDGGNDGIPNSVAIKFDIYNNEGEGPSSTGLYVNGAAPIKTGSIDLRPSGVDLHSGNPFLITITYDGTTLSVTIRDTVTNATATQTYLINIPQVIGGGTAYAGFTAGTGGNTSLQEILNWTYTPDAAQAPNAPLGLGATPASATTVYLNWTTNGSNQSGFHLDRATDPDFTQNFFTQTLPGSPNSFIDAVTGLAPGATFYYRLRAFNTGGDSGNSNAAIVTIPLAPPMPTNAVVTGVTTTTISVSWTDHAGHLTDGYRILRSVDGGTFAVVALLPPTSRTPPSTYLWSDANLTPGAYYQYHIQAYNVSGNNDFAGVNAHTLTLAPTALTATGNSSGINLSWTTAAAGALTYNVYRSTTPGGQGTTPLVTGLLATTYADTTAVAGTTYYYTVTAVNGNTTYVPVIPSESAASNQAAGVRSAAQSTALPAGWTSADVGAPALAGSAAFDGTTWTLKGAGADIWDQSDQFQFASRAVSGNQTMIVRVTSLTDTNGWAKAGLMFRAGTAHNAAAVSLLVTPDNGVTFQYRENPNGWTSFARAEAVAAPVWLRLVRSSNTFAGSYSTNGTTWVTVGTFNVNIASNVPAGLVVSSHNVSQLATATFTHFSVQGAAPKVLGRNGWTASAGSTLPGTSAAGVLDGNATTRWNAGAPQAVGQWFQIDLGAQRTIRQLVLAAAGSPADYPRGYAVYASNSPTDWSAPPIVTGTGTGATTTIALNVPVTARYVRIALTTAFASASWSIHELNAYA